MMPTARSTCPSAGQIVARSRVPPARPTGKGEAKRITSKKQIQLLKARNSKQKHFVQRCRASFQGVVSTVYTEAQQDSQVHRKRKFACDAMRLTTGCKRQKKRALSAQEKVVVMFGKINNDGTAACVLGALRRPFGPQRCRSHGRARVLDDLALCGAAVLG